MTFLFDNATIALKAFYLSMYLSVRRIGVGFGSAVTEVEPLRTMEGD